MKRIGLIDEIRLKNIPLQHHAEHELCFHLHDLMVGLLKEMEAQQVARISFTIETEEDRRLLQSGVHVLDILAQTGRGDLERRATINHVSLALFADMAHFIYEGLIALEKRKFAVAFCLLRKPFKEGMLLAAQMCADEQSFFERMKTNAKSLLERKDEASIKALLSAALKACRCSSYARPDMIYTSVFDRKNEFGLAQLFDKATHLITEFRQIETENYNINFIFKSSEDNDVYQNVYRQLSTLLLFLNLMQVNLYSRMGVAKEKYLAWILFTSIASYESMFLTGRAKLTSLVNSNFAQFLVCPTCSSKITIKKEDAPRLFIGETVDCGSCQMSTHFPFGWLLSRIEVSMLDDK